MPTLLSNIVKRIRQVYQKAEGFIEEEREFPLSQVFLNATFKRYVTDNVKILEDLHADLHDDWLRLYATLNVKGMHLVLSVDLKLVQMEMNKDMQLIVFEQISNTQVIEAEFKNIFQKWGFYIAIWYFQKFKDEDPLGKILEHFEVVTVKDELLYLDLNRWFSKKPSIIETLSKVHVNRARVRPAELIVWGNVNLAAILSPSNHDYDDDELDDTVVTPIQQKNPKK